MKYELRGVQVGIDDSSVVEIPARIFRGRLTGALFEAERAFLLPTAIVGLRGLVSFYEHHAGLPVLINGHADRAGAPAVNLDLACDRAEVVAAFLQGKVDVWLAHYASGARSLRWGAREDQHLLATFADDDSPLRAGPPSGDDDAFTREAFAAFQRAEGLPESGRGDDATRRALIARYMAQPGATLPAGTRVLTHGCGEHHPQIAAEPGVEEPRNRRMEFFFFEGDVDPPPAARCRAGGCAEYAVWVKRSVVTVDLEDEAPQYMAPFLAIEMVGEDGKPVSGVAYSVTLPDGSVREGILDSKGQARLHPVPPGLCRVRFPELDSEAWKEL